MSRRAVSGIAGLLLSAAAVAGAPVNPSPSPNPADRELVIGVYEAPPWSFQQPRGQWRGLTVDLWKELAADLKLRYRFVEAAPDVILDGISRGRFDTSVGPFADTMEDEERLDFSNAYITSGVGIAVRRSRDEDRWIAVVEGLSRPAALRLYAGVAILTFVAGTLMWLLERRRNPMFSGRPLKGLGSGFWWAGVTTVGVGYGDKVPITFWGRLTALYWMFVSLILITSFTAFVTAKLALAELGQIHGAAGLRTTTVGGVEGSAAVDFLRREQIPRKLYPSGADAIQALLKGDVKAVVYGAVILRYYADRDAAKRIDVLPGMLEPQYYAFPLADASPLRPALNQAMRRVMAETHWKDLRDRYLNESTTEGSR